MLGQAGTAALSILMPTAGCMPAVGFGHWHVAQLLVPGDADAKTAFHVAASGDAWHIMVEGLRDVGSLVYGWRADAADISRFYPGEGTGGGAPHAWSAVGRALHAWTVQ